MKRLFRPRNLVIVAIITAIVVVVLKKKQDQQFASMSDDQVRDMVHNRIADKADERTEAEVTAKALGDEPVAASASSD